MMFKRLQPIAVIASLSRSSTTAFLTPLLMASRLASTAPFTYFYATDGNTINGACSAIDESHYTYRSNLLVSEDAWEAFLRDRRIEATDGDDEPDLFWEQIKHEARIAVSSEPQAGPQLYQGILSHSGLMSAISTVIAHEIETELIPATTLKNLFMELLTDGDLFCIRRDLQAVATRSPSVEHAMDAILFHNGFHALVCYRVGHRLWQTKRTGLAYYMQSIVSRK